MRATAKHNATRGVYSKFKLSALNVPARSSLFFTLSNILCKGAAFFFTPIFTRLLSPTEYGEFSIFSTLLSLSTVAATMEMSGGVIMRLYQREKEKRFLSVLSAWIISVVLAIPITLILFFISSRGGFGMSFPLAYPFLFLSLVSISLINLYVSRCKFSYKWLPPLVTSLLQSVAAPSLSILLLGVNGMKSLDHVSVKIGAVSSVLGLIATVILVVCVKGAYAEARGESLFVHGVFGYMKRSSSFLLKLAAPLLPYYLSVMIISQADKLFISSLLGKAELAKYSVAYSAGVALTAVTGGIMSALSPWLMRRAREGDYERVRCTLDLMISVSVPAVVLFLCFAPDIFTFLAPEEYQSALPVLFISTFIPIPLALSSCSSSIAIARERVRGVLFSGILPAAVILVLDFLIIKRAPLYVTAIITASGFLILSALGVLNARKITRNYIVNVNKAFQKLLFLLILASVVYLLRELLFARMVVAVFSSLAILYLSRPLLSIVLERES